MIQAKLVFRDSTTTLDSPLNMWQHKITNGKVEQDFFYWFNSNFECTPQYIHNKNNFATQQDDNKDIWLSQFRHDKTQIALWWLAFNSYFYNCSRNSNALTSHTNFISMLQLSFGSSSSYNHPLILNLMLTWHFKPKS